MTLPSRNRIWKSSPDCLRPNSVMEASHNIEHLRVSRGKTFCWAGEQLFFYFKDHGLARTRDLRLSKQAALTSTPGPRAICIEGYHNLSETDKSFDISAIAEVKQEQTWDSGPMWGYCWPSIANAGPAIASHWTRVSCHADAGPTTNQYFAFLTIAFTRQIRNQGRFLQNWERNLSAFPYFANSSRGTWEI